MANFYPNDHPPKILQRMQSFTPSMVSDCEVTEEQAEEVAEPPASRTSSGVEMQDLYMPSALKNSVALEFKFSPGTPNTETLTNGGGISGEKKSLYDRSSLARGIMDCGTCFSKYILCLFNFIILVAGAAVLFLGVWMYADKDSLLNYAKSLDETAIPELEKYSQPEITHAIAYILMAVGGSMFILSILGYCGALRESRCLLGFYGVLLVIILVLEITAAGLAFVYKDRAEEEVRNVLKAAIKDNYSETPTKDNAPSMFLNLIMAKMHCCGVDNYTDFHASPIFVATGHKAPVYCCVFREDGGNKTILDPDCPKNPSPQNSYYLTGCYQTIMNQVKEHMNIVIYIIVGLVAVELLSTFFAFCLCKSLEPYDK